MSTFFREQLRQIATEARLHTGHLYILSRMDEASLGIFREMWPTMPVKRRRSVMQELMDITEENFEVDFDPVFLLGMGDEDAEVRATAIRCLWENENPNLIRPLIHLLKTDEAALVREAAATALGKFIYLREIEELEPGEGKLAEEALLETIYQGAEETDVRRRAIEAVAYSGDARIPPIIETAYYHDDPKMQVSAIFAMGRNADGRWLPFILQELDNPNTEIRFEAARACGEMEVLEAVEKLIELVDEESDFEVQEAAIWALGRIGGDAAREALEIYIEDENEALAMAAEAALDELNMFHDNLMLYDFTDYTGLDEDDFDDYLDIGDITNGAANLKDYLN